jgi:hypothetical protein
MRYAITDAEIAMMMMRANTCYVPHASDVVVESAELSADVPSTLSVLSLLLPSFAPPVLSRGVLLLIPSCRI